jgi:hypothetical protein
MTSMVLPVLAQILQNNPAGAGANTVTNTLELSQATSEAWDRVWLSIFRTGFATGEVGLWIGLVRFAIVLGTLSIIFLGIKEGKEILARQSWSDLATMFVWPLIVLFFLSGSGSLLANTVLLMRQIATTQVRQVLEVQVGGLTFNQAISNVALTQSARTQIDAIYLECRDKTGDALITCWNDPAKRQTAERIVSETERTNNGTLNTLRQYAQTLFSLTGTGVAGTIGTNIAALTGNGEGVDIFEPLAAPLQKLIESFLWALTWAFLNALEAALLVTGLFAPIAMALSILPLGSKPIWAWGIGFMSLFGIQLGWNMLVGLVASILVIANAQAIADLAFPVFIAIFAPILVTSVAAGGGLSLFSALNNSGGAIFNGLSNLTGTITSVIVRRI